MVGLTRKVIGMKKEKSRKTSKWAQGLLSRLAACALFSSLMS
jgi:hypothetical protein